MEFQVPTHRIRNNTSGLWRLLGIWRQFFFFMGRPCTYEITTFKKSRTKRKTKKWTTTETEESLWLKMPSFWRVIFVLLKCKSTLTLYISKGHSVFHLKNIVSWQHGVPSEDWTRAAEEGGLFKPVWWSHGFLILCSPNKWIDYMFAFLSGCYGNTAQLFSKFRPLVKCVT